jgi:hypothetical protein
VWANQYGLVRSAFYFAVGEVEIGGLAGKAAHEAMAARYEPALKEFAEGKGQKPYDADLKVKGQDRPPTDLVDSIVKQFGEIWQLRALTKSRVWPA